MLRHPQLGSAHHPVTPQGGLSGCLSTNACLCRASQPSLEESALLASHDVHTAWRHMKTANGTSHPSFLSLIISCLLLSYTWAGTLAYRCYSTGNCSMTAIKQAPCQPGRMCRLNTVEWAKGSPPACRVSAHVSLTGGLPATLPPWDSGPPLTLFHSILCFFSAQVPVSLVFAALCVGRCLPPPPVAKVLSWGLSVLSSPPSTQHASTWRACRDSLQTKGPGMPCTNHTIRKHCLASPAARPE